jgi:ubiquinone/menaquinone biosynthesis C-methylase UbiE
MNEFDLKAAGWDLNPMHIARAEAVANLIGKRIELKKSMKALEFGAGTGLTSFMLKDSLGEIIMMDNSVEMVRIMDEKIRKIESTNLKPLFFDLENNDWSGEKFNLIIAQMVLHHVNDIEKLTTRFHDMLSDDGYLAIADLYPEDGSFHGQDFNGHLGFDPEVLSRMVQKYGFGNASFEKCFVINKKLSENENKQFDVFLLIAKKL